MPKTETPAPPAPANQVILAITRAQLHALRWLAAPAKRKPTPWPAQRVFDSLRWKNLSTGAGHYDRAARDLTPAGRALLAALNQLHPTKPQRTR